MKNEERLAGEGTASVKMRKFNRRRFLIAALLATPILAAADARCLEPKWVKTRRLRLGRGKPTHRLVHFTDRVFEL